MGPGMDRRLRIKIMNDDITHRAFWNEKRVTQIITDGKDRPVALAEFTLKDDPILHSIHNETLKQLREVNKVS